MENRIFKLISVLFKDLSYCYWKGQVTKKGENKEIFNLPVYPRNGWMTGVKFKSQEPWWSSGSLTRRAGAQGLEPLFSLGHKQGDRLEVEQLGIEQVLRWDAGACRQRFNCQIDLIFQLMKWAFLQEKATLMQNTKQIHKQVCAYILIDELSSRD